MNKDKVIIVARWTLWSIFGLCVLGYLLFCWKMKVLNDEIVELEKNGGSLYCANTVTAPIRFVTDLLVPIQLASLIGLLVLAIKKKENLAVVLMGFLTFIILLVSILSFANWTAKGAYLIDAIWWWI